VTARTIPPEAWLALSGLLAAAVTAAGAYVAAHRANKRMAEIERDKQDISEAELRHRTTQDLISNLRAEVERLEAQVSDLRRALAKEQEENGNLRVRLHEVTQTANNLRHQVMVLQQQLGVSDD
jgi:septal ring factor EnvC (AmiA/AmiB activator)